MWCFSEWAAGRKSELGFTQVLLSLSSQIWQEHSSEKTDMPEIVTSIYIHCQSNISGHQNIHLDNQETTPDKSTILRLPLTTEWLFGFNVPGHFLVRERFLHCMPVRWRDGYSRASRANNATCVHAQGSDQTRWSQKVTPFLKVIKL